MTTSLSKSAAACLLLAAMLFATSGGLAADRDLEMAYASGAICAPDLGSVSADTLWSGPDKPEHHGDPDDPDKTPPSILFYFVSRFFMLGR